MYHMHTYISCHMLFFSWAVQSKTRPWQRNAHTGPPFLSPPIPLSLSLFPPSLFLSPLLGSPQLRRPGAFRPSTHTHAHPHSLTHARAHTPHTSQRTQQEMPNTSFRMMPLCRRDSEAARIRRQREEEADGKRRWRRPRLETE